MGAWGYNNFDNDDAADFLAEFREDPSEVLLLEALVTAVEEEGYLEVDAAGAALAAAEVVAAWLGQPSPDFPDDLLPRADNLDVSDEDELVELAQQATRAVLQKSEMRDLWEESAEFTQWQAAQANLLERLA
ncbi:MULTISPECIES: DUF4259 domain-containing protein [Hymenobacter]|uniref:DUF4259 domain-containing protein n=1 Tax=Hymenobacter mucosus TaxID=1411120 RepID=A0A238V5E3_9BACT|nr:MULTISPECIES: DUF4259 domain-containing protein [Hymenobacter]SNR29685.1 protein of unknown function [Hymenobacter mucosus]